MTAILDLSAPVLEQPGYVDLVQTTPRLTVCIDGYGDRDHEAVRKAFETLRPIAWALHVAFRDGAGQPHQLAPLEALWWNDRDEEHSPQRWRVFVGEQASVPTEVVERLVRDLPATKGLPAGQLLDVRLLDDGLAVQTLHVGPLENIADSEARLATYMDEHDLVAEGPRHEIYLSHVRRCDPAHLRTIVRRPVRPR